MRGLESLPLTDGPSEVFDVFHRLSQSIRDRIYSPYILVDFPCVPHFNGANGFHGRLYACWAESLELHDDRASMWLHPGKQETRSGASIEVMT